MNPSDMTAYTDLAMAWLIENALTLLGAIVILVIGTFIVKLLANGFRKALDKRGTDPLLSGFLRSLVYWALMTAVIIAAISHMGFDATSLIAILGTLGLAIGLAIKDNISNFSSGVLLILFRPFTVGDFVEVAGVAGVVQEISLSTTLIHSPDNQKIIVPNSQIMGQVITNVTGNDSRRIDMVVGIGYDDDIDAAKAVLEKVIAADPGVLETPAPTVAVSEMADSSVNFVVRPWCATTDYWKVRFRLTETIKKSLDEAGISIPYPQTDVHLHKVEQ